MTPAARISAAIEVLDRVLAGEAAEKVLTGWARASRFAGSGDRAALRDLVFDALRRRRSLAVLGGADTGRGLLLGMIADQGPDAPARAEALFDGSRHGPAPLSEEERRSLAAPPALMPEDAADLPDWALARLRSDWGADAPAIAEALRHRAPLFLRANLRRASLQGAIDRLAEEAIAAVPHPLAPTALLVTQGARAVQRSRAYLEGLVEVQDAASQAVVAALPLRPGTRVLDYCAGGGGKALAMLGRADVTVVAHDADPRRMADLPARADRAGVPVTVSATDDLPRLAPFDLVLCDVPCSGSGAWRRSPDARWRSTEAGLDRLTQTQDAILDAAAGLVADGGTLAHVTCSLFDDENHARVAAFRARHGEWSLILERRWSPLDGGDGFYLACLSRP
jgi:16S rRNA (cytosine967-C5)-methyltransferase